MKVLGVIPARYGSTRLPAKPLQLLKGKPLIQWVYENAKRCRKIDRLIVATDHPSILNTVKEFGGEAILTPPDLNSGTDRCAYVAKGLDYQIVVNIQGDEPFILPGIIDATIEVLERNSKCVMVTVGRRGITKEELENPNVVKVLVDRHKDAIYFSRQNIPYIRDRIENLTAHPALVHYGLYTYRKDFLIRFSQLPILELERLEKLEQLRALENGYKIRVVETTHYSLGIDTPDDLKKAEQYIETYEKEE